MGKRLENYQCTKRGFLGGESLVMGFFSLLLNIFHICYIGHVLLLQWGKNTTKLYFNILGLAWALCQNAEQGMCVACPV